jgi:hypothetical protein
MTWMEFFAMFIHLEVLTYRFVNLIEPILQNPFSYIPKIKLFHFCETNDEIHKKWLPYHVDWPWLIISSSKKDGFSTIFNASLLPCFVLHYLIPKWFLPPNHFDRCLQFELPLKLSCMELHDFFTSYLVVGHGQLPSVEMDGFFCCYSQRFLFLFFVFFVKKLPPHPLS